VATNNLNDMWPLYHWVNRFQLYSTTTIVTQPNPDETW